MILSPGPFCTAGWKFYGAADVVDPDQEDGGETYTFDMRDEPHGACFNLGEDEEGNTLISWSWLHAIYSLPDGSIWAEHSDFIDRSDMVRDFEGVGLMGFGFSQAR